MNYPHALNYPHASNHYVPNHHASGHHAPNHHFPSHHTPNHHGQNQYAPSHGQNHHAPSHGQSYHAPSHHSQSHHAPSHHHASSHHAPNPLPLTHDYLTDGYISYTFGSRIAEGYVAHLFSIDAASVQTVRQGDAFYALNLPSYNIPPTLSVSGHDAWLLDFAVRSGGSVVPQQLWSPQGQGDRRRYVEQAQIRMPVFFINTNGSLGVPVMSAAAGDMQLHGGHLPPQLADKSTVKLRINWPGYALPEQQVQLRDQTPARNPISFERFVKHVGSRVKQYLLDCERVPMQPNNWIVGQGNITFDQVMLIGLVQVSEGSWMPILQLMRRVVM